MEKTRPIADLIVEQLLDAVEQCGWCETCEEENGCDEEDCIWYRAKKLAQDYLKIQDERCNGK